MRNKKEQPTHSCRLCEQCKEVWQQQMVDWTKEFILRCIDMEREAHLTRVKPFVEAFVKEQAPSIMREAFTAELVLVARDKLKADIDRMFSEGPSQ